VIGTSGSLLGVPDGAGYRDADITRREKYLTLPTDKGGEGRTLNEAREIISRELRRDPLDKGPYRGDFDSPGRTLLETYTFSTTGLMELDTFNVETNFGYLDYRKSERRDTDLTPNIRFPSNGNDQAWEIFGDLQFSGDQIGNAVIEWDTGVTTLIQKVEASQVQFIGDVIADNGFTEQLYSYGIYASFRYEFLEAFTLAGGVRYNWEKKNFRVKDRRTRFNPFTGQPITFPPRRSSNQLTWDDMTGFAEIRYDFTEDISSYMKYSRGFKAGHFNPSVPDKAEVPGEGFADPEKIDSFEWGLQVNAWASRVRAEGAFFFYNYQNYQVFRLTTTPEGVFRVIRNAKRARNYGAELDVTISPLEGFVPEAVEGLRITLRGGWLETEFLDYVEEDVRIFGAFPATVQIDNSGNPLLNAPTLQASGTITWELISQQLGTFIPQYDFTWTDDVPFDPNKGRGQIDGFGDSKFQPYLIGNLSYLLHNVRLTWRPPGDPGLQLSGWCRNLTDERYSTFAVDISNFAQSQLHYVADPRSCGADIRFTW
jgi:outer membrane receptor protein involved in Fe transport